MCIRDRAIVEKKPQLVQTGIIIGCAFCEAISIFGMVLAFLFAYQYFFVWFGLGILGIPVSYTHLRAHETVLDLVCRLLLEKKNYTSPIR